MEKVGFHTAWGKKELLKRIGHLEKSPAEVGKVHPLHSAEGAYLGEINQLLEEEDPFKIPSVCKNGLKYRKNGNDLHISIETTLQPDAVFFFSLCCFPIILQEEVSFQATAISFFLIILIVHIYLFYHSLCVEVRICEAVSCLRLRPNYGIMCLYQLSHLDGQQQIFLSLHLMFYHLFPFISIPFTMSLILLF